MAIDVSTSVPLAHEIIVNFILYEQIVALITPKPGKADRVIHTNKFTRHILILFLG
jgi:hypothetical protein